MPVLSASGGWRPGAVIDGHEMTVAKRTFELVGLYADCPVNLADASLVVAAEALETLKIYTLDRNDFATYRVRCGHRNHVLEAFG
jgi:predicted nucleic acid-binding protein